MTERRRADDRKHGGCGQAGEKEGETRILIPSPTGERGRGGLGVISE